MPRLQPGQPKPPTPTEQRRQLAVRVAATTGGTAKAIHERLPDIPYETLRTWMGSDWWSGNVQAEMDRLILSPIDAMTPFLQKALLALDKALDEGDLAAAKEVFDRIYGKPMQRQQSDTSPRITIVFTDHEPTAVIDITPQGSSNQAED